MPGLEQDGKSNIKILPGDMEGAANNFDLLGLQAIVVDLEGFALTLDFDHE